VLPGAIDFAIFLSDDINKPASIDAGAVWGFRCAFEVNP
jgi:hypothetical protein